MPQGELKLCPQSVEAACRAICRSGKFETGEGVCAARCMEFLGNPRKAGCAHAVTVHGDFAKLVLGTAECARLRAMYDEGEQPNEPGGFVGDIFFGDPKHSCRGTHKWTGEKWEKLPDEVEALIGLLAAARASEARLRAMCEELAGAAQMAAERLSIEAQLRSTGYAGEEERLRGKMGSIATDLFRAGAAYAKYLEQK